MKKQCTRARLEFSGESGVAVSREVHILRTLNTVWVTEFISFITFLLVLCTLAQLFVDNYYVCATADAALIIGPRVRDSHVRMLNSKVNSGNMMRGGLANLATSGQSLVEFGNAAGNDAEQFASTRSFANLRVKQSLGQARLDPLDSVQDADPVYITCRKRGMREVWHHRYDVAILVISVVLLAELVLRMWCTGPIVFFYRRIQSQGEPLPWLSWNTFDFVIVFSSVFVGIQVVLLNRDPGPFKGVLSVLRYSRLIMLYYAVRRRAGQKHLSVEECTYITDALTTFKAKMGPETEVHNVQVVLNSDNQKRLFFEKKKQIMDMSPRYENVKQVWRILFFGPSDTDPDMILEDEVGLDFRFSKEGRLGKALYGAENPQYSDSAFAYVNPTAGGRYVRKMIVYLGLVGKSLDFNLEKIAEDDGVAYDRRKLFRNPKGYDSVCAGPWLAHEYTDGCQAVGLPVRDVRSKVYAFYDNLQVLPLAVITYTCKASEEEQERLEERGFVLQSGAGSFRSSELMEYAEEKKKERRSKLGRDAWVEVGAFEEAADLLAFQRLSKEAFDSVEKERQ